MRGKPNDRRSLPLTKSTAGAGYVLVRDRGAHYRLDYDARACRATDSAQSVNLVKGRIGADSSSLLGGFVSSFDSLPSGGQSCRPTRPDFSSMLTSPKLHHARNSDYVLGVPQASSGFHYRPLVSAPAWSRLVEIRGVPLTKKRSTVVDR